MLKSLLIKNYALIRHLEISPSPHLNIITGETGAGKSIILGAVGLLLGNRIEGKPLLDEKEKCVVECVFGLKGYPVKHIFEEAEIEYEDNCIIRREITPAGKSRAFINDTPCTLDTLKLLGSQLMDIHSQHDTQLLGSNTYQLGIVDTFAQTQSLQNNYKTAYEAFKKAEQAYRAMQAEANRDKKELEFNKYQLEELNTLKYRTGEADELEAELRMLENAGDIKVRLNQCLELLSAADDTVNSRLKTVSANLERLASFGENYAILAARVETAYLDLRDVADELEQLEDKVDTDSDRIDAVNSRLSLIFTLQKKHGVRKPEELLKIKSDLQQMVNRQENMDEELKSARDLAKSLLETVRREAKLLTEARLAALPVLEKELSALFVEVGMPNASIRITHSEAPLSPTGTDAVNLLFSANKGVKPQELKNAASGGEFSRLMLCIKFILAGKTLLPTIIFDEIDTGISGEIAIRVGRMMQKMSAKHQLVAITHLPQIAARAKAHYYVYKDHSQDRTVSNMRLLSPDEQVQEIASMISGAVPTEASLSNARELISMKG